MKQKIFLPILIASIACFLAACSTNETSAPLTVQQAARSEIKIKNRALEEKIDALPPWILNPPKSDEQAVYAVGIGDSDILQISMKKAMLEAEFGLAKQLKQELAGSERQYTTDDSIHATNRFEGLIDKLVEETPIIGYSIKQQIVKPMDGRYQTFILLMLPYDQYNNILQANKAKEIRNEMKDAFTDLERRLDKKKTERKFREEPVVNNQKINNPEAKETLSPSK